MNRRTFLSSLAVGLLSVPLLAKVATKSCHLGPVRYADCDDFRTELPADGYFGFLVFREKGTGILYRFGVKERLATKRYWPHRPTPYIVDRITRHGPVGVAEFEEHLTIHRTNAHITGKLAMIDRTIIKPPTVHVTWREWEET